MAERKQAKASKPLVFWLLGATCAALTLAIAGCLALFYGSGEQESLRAISASQSVTINLKTGEISGAAQNTPAEPVTESTTQEQAPAFDVGEAETIIPAESISEIEPAQDEIPTTKSDLIASEDEAANSIPVYPRSSASLAEPTQELTRDGIPSAGQPGTPMRYYARPFIPRANTALIAIMVTNMGQTKAASEAAFKLPLDVSLIFNPYGEFTPLWVESARNLGHESWLMLPAQPADFPASDPGPLGLLKEAPAEANLNRLHQLLKIAPGAVGLMLPAAEALTESGAATDTLINDLKNRGFALGLSERPSAALEQKLDSIKTQRLPTPFILDARPDPASMAAQLNALEKVAQAKGFALGISLGYPASIATVDNWARGLDPNKFQLVPASALLGRQ